MNELKDFPLLRSVFCCDDTVVDDDDGANDDALNCAVDDVYDGAAVEEAEALYRATYEAQKKKLGKDHPDTLMSANNLALLLAKTGRKEEAEALYRATDDAEANMERALVQALVDGGLTVDEARAAIRGYTSTREA